MERLVSAAGGRQWQATASADLQPLFMRALAEMRARYLLTFYPQGVAREGWHDLKVTLKRAPRRRHRAAWLLRSGSLAGRGVGPPSVRRRTARPQRYSNVMNFEGDAFISYAHLDNVELVEGHKGWVANLHRALEIRVAQLLGKQSRIWRDPKLAGQRRLRRDARRAAAARGGARLGRLAALRQVGVGPQGARRVLQGRRRSRAASASATRRASSRC